MSEPLLRVSGLTMEFSLGGGLFGRNAITIHAVDGVDFHIDRGETLGSRRRIRLRQVNHRTLRAAPDRTNRGRDLF